MNFELKLIEGLKDAESAKKVVKEVQQAFDELVESNNEVFQFPIGTFKLKNPCG